MEINNRIDYKTFYRFIEFTTKLYGTSIPHEKLKLISLDMISPIGEDECLVKSFSNSFLFLLNNIQNMDTLSVIKMSYYILSSIELENGDIERLSEIFTSPISPYIKASKAHLLILSSNLKKKELFAFEISNYILLFSNEPISIIYKKNKEAYFDAIKRGDINLLSECFKLSKSIKNDPNIILYSRDDIIIKIKTVSTKLEKKFNISHIYLYGSFAKNIYGIYSDIDFLYEYRSDDLTIDYTIIEKEAGDFLSSIFPGIKVDLILYRKAQMELEEIELKNAIKIF